MKQAVWMAVVFGVVAVTAGLVDAKDKTVAGAWTLTVEQHFVLKLELTQKNAAVAGTLDWPHGDPITLTGSLKGNTLTFSGDSSGENFTIHVDSTGTLKGDGTMTGTLQAHFVEVNDAHEVVRKRDQEIPWTAERGLHGIVHFPR